MRERIRHFTKTQNGLGARIDILAIERDGARRNQITEEGGAEMNSLIGYEVVEIVSKGPSHAATVELVRRPEYGMFETTEEAQEVSKQLGQGFSIADIEGAA